MRDRIAEVMAAVLEVPVASISDEMALNYTKNWDSLKHMNLILALEDEFKVAFTDEEVIEMISFPLILQVLEEKIPSQK